MHPSDPAFPFDKSTINRASLENDPAKLILEAVVSGSFEVEPVEMLRTQLYVAIEQLNAARLQLVKSRRRVTDLQEVVFRLEEFLQTAISNSSNDGAFLGELKSLERYTA